MDKNFWNDITQEYLRTLPLPSLRSLARRAGIGDYGIKTSTALCEALLAKKEALIREESTRGKDGRPEGKAEPRPQAATVADTATASAAGAEAAAPAGGAPAAADEETPRRRNGAMAFNETNMADCDLREGLLEVLPDGYGFIRVEGFRNTPRDAYVASMRIRRYNLRMGDYVKAYVRPTYDGKPAAVVNIVSVNGHEDWQPDTRRPTFENFTPVYPNERFRLEVANKRTELATRCIDLLAPIGKGQRAMIVSPPKAGKTTLLKMIANSLTVNHPEARLLVLLIDERPEEVTDMQRSIKGDVYYSTFDEECDNHIKVAEMVLARAKRLVEEGEDVVILLDSLTRMARANNVVVPSSGKTLSGGVDPVALYFPKRFFGAARNIENGGSLTIIATALVDTGSRMDDIVYEEFKGTGNMEVHLDRRLSEKRIFPAIDLARSGTRKEELLLTQKELEGEYNIRRLLAAGDTQEAAEAIIGDMSKTANNAEFLRNIELRIIKLRKDGFHI